jgi:hypothetical protein
LGNPAQPGGSVTLTSDSSGTKPGPVVTANAGLIVVDGELKSNTWIYSVRTQQGATGWISEKQLKAAK